jgi:iron complex transport system ATP-binding protein
MNGLTVSKLTLVRNGAALVDDVSLEFAATGSIAIIGPNGAGKSSLLKMMAAVLAPTSGAVAIAGRDIRLLSGAERARLVGYVPQQFEPHWDFSVNELIHLGLSRAGQAEKISVDYALAQFELAALNERRWASLSGGERGRVLMAMVQSTTPRILLADEPGASLDIQHRLQLARALADYGRDHLAIVVMHDLDLAFRFFERVIVMDRGRIVADSPAAELFREPLLDETFGVRFERLRSASVQSLYPLD